MSDEQVMEWLESEVGHMEDVVSAIEDGGTGMEEAAGLIGGLAQEISELRHAVLVD